MSRFDALASGLRGALTPNADLGARTWFRAGGRADLLFEPKDKDDLALFLKNCDEKIPILVMGAGSNMLVRDGGVRGAVIILGKAFAGVEVKSQNITAGPALPARQLAQRAAEDGLTGFEFLRGIPGSMGGCVAMNAGAYDRATADIFVEAKALDRSGAEHLLTGKDMAFGYRQSIILSISSGTSQRYIVIEAAFKGEKGDRAQIKARMEQIVAERQASQPAGARTGGSTFKNPAKNPVKNPKGAEDQKAWQLIEQAGCRDLSCGDAYVCDKHCNFLVNGGRASAADIERLGEEIRRRVAERTGIMLEWEIRRVGEAR